MQNITQEKIFFIFIYYAKELYHKSRLHHHPRGLHWKGMLTGLKLKKLTVPLSTTASFNGAGSEEHSLWSLLNVCRSGRGEDCLKKNKQTQNRLQTESHYSKYPDLCKAILI